MKQCNIIIVGGGMAGLIAAREISKEARVTLIESRQDLGGRIRTEFLPGMETAIEGGAEFVHGRLPLTLALLKEAGIGYVPAEGKMYRREKEKWIEEEDMIEGWDQLLKQMKKLKQDITLSDFLSKYYAGDKYADFRRYLISFVEGFDLADPQKVSVLSLLAEWSNEEEKNFRIPAGYMSLVHFLENECIKNGCRIVKGETVKQIDWQQDDVVVHTAGGRKYNGEKILITVPVSVLKDIAGKCAINFTPPADEYIQAVSQIGFGTVVKIILHFSQPFWKEDARFMLSDEMFPTWWTQLPSKIPVLTGWAGGSKAAVINQHTDAELLNIALISLGHIFNKPVQELQNNLLHSYVFNWKGYEDTLGAYSYATPQSSSARKLLKQSLANTVFFAGEGLYEGLYPGTVEAALSSGKLTARQLLESLQ